MSRLSISWFIFWKNRKLLFAAFIVILFGLLAFSAYHLKIYEDITKTLPQSESFEKLKKIVEHRGLNSSIYLSIHDGEEWETERMRALGTKFCADLNDKCGEYIQDLRFGAGEDERGIYDFIEARLPYYLESFDYDAIGLRLETDSMVSRLQANHQKLFTPEGLFLKDYLIRDPLSITPMALMKFKNLEEESVFKLEDDLFKMNEDGSLFITGNVKIDDETSSIRSELAADLEAVANEWRADGYEINYFSGFLIAAANAEQIKSDTTLTLSVSLSAIILLLLFYYRSVVLPLYFILPAIFGLVFSIGLVALLKDEVSAISIGAGAVVLGIIMDYSFHFFTHLKHSGSVEETLRDVTNPLLTGCLTTILAFLALTFTNSPVLQDFGLFAAMSLIGAAIAVIFLLPVFLPGKLAEKWSKSKERKFNFKIGKRLGFGIAIAIIGFSVVAIIAAPNIGFDDDLMNLNHYPEDLKEAENRFKKLDPNKERSMFVISTDEDRELAKDGNSKAYQVLKDLKESGKVSGLLSTAIFDVPEQLAEERMHGWDEFWEAQQPRVNEIIDSMENELSYYDDTFDAFKIRVSGSYKVPDSAKVLPLVSSDMQKLIDSTQGEWSYITILSVPTEHVDSVIITLEESLDQSEVFSTSEMASALVKTVRDDFNFILLTSSLLVFLTLLLIYGRIELALITFLPMILSWVWILGIAAMMEIEFNFVNIVISTFIFGLGDDFAIFITDGYVSKFSKNKDVIHSYRKGILLSAATTIFGTGALLFAVHPALNSVALISVIGMVAIIIISFTVQPWLLRKMLTSRKERGLPPVSLINFIFYIHCWVFFLSGCLTLFPIAMIMRLFPFGQKRLKLIYHHFMRIFAWMQMYFMINLRKKIVNKENLDFKKPSMIVVNHQSAIDVVMMMSLHPKMIIMTNDWVYNSPFFGSQIKYLGFFPGSHGVERNLEAIRPWVEDGYSVVIFPEGTRSKNKKIGRFHKGAFFLAKELNLDITPVLLHGFNDGMRKGDMMLLNAKTSVVALPRIKADDESWGTTYQERGKAISKYFKEEFRKYDLENAGSYYLQHKIISNYIYRSPLIEWYVKVKWMFEKKNFDHYHTLIPTEGRVYDLGCGYGYLSYFLYFRSEDRHLIGMDYDAEKITIANNCYSKNESVEFESGDIRQLEIKDADAIFLNDVIHYLPEEDHEKILDRCLANLNPEGTILIRDGVTDLNDRHKKTEKTEKYSTQIIGFNKTVNNLCFFSKAFIEDFAKKNNLSCEIHEQSSKTSNILFVLKRI